MAVLPEQATLMAATELARTLLAEAQSCLRLAVVSEGRIVLQQPHREALEEPFSSGQLEELVEPEEMDAEAPISRAHLQVVAEAQVGTAVLEDKARMETVAPAPLDLAEEAEEAEGLIRQAVAVEAAAE
jgi:hypothetical protein